MNKEKIRIIAFDADDTLWHHEIYFYNAIEFCHFFFFHLLIKTGLRKNF